MKRKIWLFFFYLGHCYLSLYLMFLLHLRSDSELKEQFKDLVLSHPLILGMVAIISFTDVIFVAASLMYSIYHIARNQLFSLSRKIVWSVLLAFLPLGLGILLYWSVYGKTDSKLVRQMLNSEQRSTKDVALDFEYDTRLLKSRYLIISLVSTVTVVLIHFMLFSTGRLTLKQGLLPGTVMLALFVGIPLLLRFITPKSFPSRGYVFNTDGVLWIASAQSRFIKFESITKVVVYAENSFFSPGLILLNGWDMPVSVKNREAFLDRLRMNVSGDCSFEYK
ncbi:MAG: hypothetical protein WC889_10635 [Myxococcota bacterium]|jgi:hypothetical protein